MELIIKHFNDLTTSELFDILHLRISVFIVEQNCPYQELDEFDRCAYHIYLRSDDKIIAYLRVFAKDEYINEYINDSVPLQNVAIIGRVVSIDRRKGYATTLLKEAIKLIKHSFTTDTIVLEAQVYAKSLYEKLGFEQVSEEFLEDGIPHVQMQLKC